MGLRRSRYRYGGVVVVVGGGRCGIAPFVGAGRICVMVIGDLGVGGGNVGRQRSHGWQVAVFVGRHRCWRGLEESVLGGSVGRQRC